MPINRIIPTIGEHVIAHEALAGGSKCVRIDESAHLRVIVSALQVVQAGFLVVDIAPVGEGIGPRRLRIYGKQMITDIQ